MPHFTRRRSNISTARLLGGLLLGAAGAGCSSPPAPPPVESKVVYSDAFTIDTTWASMQGPYRVLQVQLTDSTTHELVWVTGYEAAIVDADTRVEKSTEFMCHSNVDLDMARHRQLFGWEQKYPSRRLFTLSEGQTEVKLPDGFGVPLRSDEPLSVTAQVLNHNYHGAPIRVRQRVTVHFIRDRALKKSLIPLYQRGINTLVRLDGPGGGYNTAVDDHAAHMHASGDMSADDQPYKDKQGRTFAGHWVVKPGREVRRTPVNGWLQMTSDLKVHYVAVHMHPFGESLRLIDKTTGDTVLASKAENRPERIGLARVEQIASPEGITLYKDHDYELESRYNNTSGTNRTAMAVMYLYMEDTEFKRRQ
jgi:hypothetical protein